MDADDKDQKQQHEQQHEQQHPTLSVDQIECILVLWHCGWRTDRIGRLLGLSVLTVNHYIALNWKLCRPPQSWESASIH